MMLLLDADSFIGAPLVFEYHDIVGTVRPKDVQLKDTLENSVTTRFIGVMVRVCPPM